MNAYSLSRLFIARLTCLATLLFAPLLPAVEAEKRRRQQPNNTLSIHIDDMLRPWRRFARHDRPSYHSGINHLQQDLLFIDKGTQRGATHDIFIALENELNKQLAKDKKLKQRHLKLHIVLCRSVGTISLSRLMKVKAILRLPI